MTSVAEASGDLASWAEATNIGDTSLAMLTEVPTQLATRYLHDDPGTVFLQTARARERVVTLLQGRQHPRQTRDLFVIAGRLSALLSWIAGDLSRPWEAWTHGRTALVCAELAEHDGTRALGFAGLSKTAFWQGRYADAADLAEQGRRLRPAGTLDVLLACQEADAHAEQGVVPRTRASPSRLAAARDDAQPADEVGGVLGCTQARQENYVAGVHVRLEDTRRAISAADRALRLLSAAPQPVYGTAAQVRITRGFALAAEQDLDGLIDALEGVFALTPEHRLATIAARLRKVPPLVTMTGGARGRHLAEQVDDFCRTVSQPVRLRAVKALRDERG